MIKSPITGSENIIEEQNISSNIIIERYKTKLNIDVSRFFTEVENVKIFKCNDTGYRFFYPLHLAGDAEFYEDLQETLKGKIDYYPQNKLEFKIAKSIIKKDYFVLDIGCGSGLFLEGITDITKNILGLEFNDKAIVSCEQKNLPVIKEFIENFSIQNENKYDVVVYFQVLEHIENVKSFIESSLKVLKKGGKLIIAVPDNSPYISGYHIFDPTNLPPHHMGMWNIETFKSISKIFNLNLKDVSYTEKYPFLKNWYYYTAYQLRSIFENKLLFLPLLAISSIFTLPVISYKYFSNKIKGHSIIVTFEK